MKSNITQAFFWKTGKKMEINSTVTGIIDYKCAKYTKKYLKYCLLYKKCTLKDGKTGKNIDRYGKGCYHKSKLRAAKKRACSKKHRHFCKKLLFFGILVRPLDK